MATTKFKYGNSVKIISDGKYADGFFDGKIVSIVAYERWHDCYKYIFVLDGKEYTIREEMLMAN